MAEKELEEKGEAREDRAALGTGTPCLADFTLPDGPHPAPKFVLDHRALLAAAAEAAADEEHSVAHPKAAPVLEGPLTTKRLIELDALVARQARTIAELNTRLAAMGSELGSRWASLGDDGSGLAARRRTGGTGRAVRRRPAPVTVVRRSDASANGAETLVA